MPYRNGLIVFGAMLALFVGSDAAAQNTSLLSDTEMASLACPPDPSLGPEIAARRFLFGFTRMDRECFDQMWAEDATAFLPIQLGDQGPGRLEGKSEIMLAFDQFFEGTQPTGEDQMGISPERLKVDRHGDVAIATFLLGPELDNRRSFILRQEEKGWRIWHHHGSWLGNWDEAIEGELRRRLAAVGNKDRPDVLATIDTFLQSIKKQDADMMASVTIPTGRVAGIFSEEGEENLIVSSFAEEYMRVRSGSDNEWVETIWNPTIVIEGRLAMVSAPYSMQVDSKPAHCGVDVFNLMQIEGAWKIVAIQFTADPIGCPSWMSEVASAN